MHTYLKYHIVAPHSGLTTLCVYFQNLIFYNPRTINVKTSKNIDPNFPIVEPSIYKITTSMITELSEGD